jgi:hypothetical protein
MRRALHQGSVSTRIIGRAGLNRNLEKYVPETGENAFTRVVNMTYKRICLSAYIDIQKNNFAALSVGVILQYYLLPAALRNEFSEKSIDILNFIFPVYP